MKRFAALLLVLPLVVAACGSAGGSPPPSDADDGASGPPPSASEGGEDDGGDGAIEHPTGADEPILVVSSQGGFVPVEFSVRALPSFVLLGDGRVIVQGAQTLEFPGPALPALQERTLTEDGIQELLSAIEDTGLFTGDLELRGMQQMVADASDTVFELHAAGLDSTVLVYALGMLMPDMEVPGMDPAEVAAHEALARLSESLLLVDTFLPAEMWESEGWQPYEPEAFRLYVTDVTDQPIEGGDLPGMVREWPTGDDPATFGDEAGDFLGPGTRCGVVEGELGATWLGELAEANENTLWTDDGERRFRVLARPLLPHEERTCPELGPGA
jgi:hypothetical protein